MTPRYTQILPQFPGYMYDFNPETSTWTLCWEPVTNVYSPPCLHHGVHMRSIPFVISGREYPSSQMIGRLIGKNGWFFKYVTETSRSLYIFYQPTTRHIEIWGLSQESVDTAVKLLTRRMTRLFVHQHNQ